ncbi:MAG: transcriptional regulator NrdR [bacterium]
MKCPFCDNPDSKVLDTRSMEDNSVIRRRRCCEKCLNRFNTYERIDVIRPITVIKNNFNEEDFSNDKLMKGLLLACNKRPVSVQELEEVVKRIENKIYNNNNKKIVYSREIGEYVMEELRLLDDVAYVRFASVYRDFDDVNTFNSFIQEVIENLDNNSNNSNNK